MRPTTPDGRATGPAGAGRSPAETHFLAGVRAQGAGRTAEAEDHYRLALEADAGHAGAWANLGLLLLRSGRPAQAEAALARATALEPSLASSWCYLGEARHARLDFAGAEAALDRALALAPGMALAATHLGKVYTDIGRPGPAVALFESALAAMPDLDEARWPRVLALFRSGDWKQGFAWYEARFARQDCRPASYPQPLWDGSPLGGRTILLHHEQGLGDTIMCCRFAAVVAGRGGRVLLGCQPELAELAATAQGVERVVVPGERFRADCRAPLMSLPAILGLDQKTIPAPSPYLAVPPGAQCPVPRPAGTRLAVGIVWAGNPRHANDLYRSAALRHFLRLAEVPGVVLYSLQYGERAGDIQGLGAKALVQSLEGSGPFPAKAAAMAGLDLVVSVDTSEAHLAGALGRPVWVPLPFRPDWRWTPGSPDTPWYPSMRLFHQDVPGRWEGVFAAMRDALAAGGP